MSEDPSRHRSPNRKHERCFFYKYTTAKTAEIILSTRKLRWSSPVKFNDPFDVTQELRLNFTEAELDKVLGEEVASLIEKGAFDSLDSYPGIPPELTDLLKFMSPKSPDQLRAMAQQLRLESGTATPGLIHQLKGHWRRIVPTFRILCLSELRDVNSMWQHYADSYMGVVFEFEAVDEIDSCFLVARPVVYQDSPPAIADPKQWARCMMLGPTKCEELFTEYTYVKTTDWWNEREWRIVSSARPGEAGLSADYCFHPRELVGIYFGEQCSAEQRANLWALLTHGLEHVQVYEALQDKVEAKFNFSEIRR